MLHRLLAQAGFDLLKAREPWWGLVGEISENLPHERGEQKHIQ